MRIGSFLIRMGNWRGLLRIRGPGGMILSSVWLGSRGGKWWDGDGSRDLLSCLYFGRVSIVYA